MKLKFTLTIILFTFLLYACSSYQQENIELCPPPPSDFSEADLFGSWTAGIPSVNDTIIIREDGFYKQFIHINYIEDPDLNYESDWQPWWVEYTETGIPYLHLEGMRMCVYWQGMDCEQEGGGTWYDGCKEEWIDTPGEGLLMILGVPQQYNQPPRGFDLVSLQRSTLDVTVYSFEEPLEDQ